MILIFLTFTIFLVSFGLFASGAYFLVQQPLAKQKLKTRLAAVQQVGLQADADADSELLRRELLSDIPALNRILATAPLVPRLQLFLQQGAVEMQLATYMLIVVSATLFSWVITLVVTGKMINAVVFAALAAVAPFAVVGYKRKRRFHRFEELFPDSIDLLARAVRAGHAFTTAFSLIGDEMPDPIAQEFKFTYRQQNLGLPLREALANMAVRLPLPDVRIFVSALQIQRDSGGNLGEILDNLSSVVRERFSLLREVQVVTAEARLSMYVLTAMPFIAGMLMYLSNPDYMTPLFVDPIGHKMLIGGGIMQVIGYFVIRKLVKIKI